LIYKSSNFSKYFGVDVILLKVALNAIKQTNIQTHKLYFYISVKYYILELKLIISYTLKSGRNLSVSIGVVLELNVGVLL